MFLVLLLLLLSAFFFYSKDYLTGALSLVVATVIFTGAMYQASLNVECKELGGVLFGEYCVDKKYTIPLNHQK